MKINEDDLLRHLAKTYLLMHRRVDREMTKHGASLARTKMLLVIEEGDGAARAADIAELFDLAPRTVTEALDALERDGLVIRTPDPADRRVKRIAITPQGQSAIAATEPLRKRLVREMCAPLSEDDLLKLHDILGRWSAALESGAAVGEYRGP